MVQQGDGVEDAPYDEQLVDLHLVERRRAPSDALIALTGLEAGLLLAEALGAVDQAFSIAALVQGEADGGTADVDVAAPVVLLNESAVDELKAKAPGKLQVGAGGGGRLFGGRRCLLAPVVEQVAVEVLDVDAVVARFRPAADQHPGRLVEGVQGVFAALVRGAFVLVHVVDAGHVLRPKSDSIRRRTSPLSFSCIVMELPYVAARPGRPLALRWCVCGRQAPGSRRGCGGCADSPARCGNGRRTSARSCRGVARRAGC